MLPTLARLCDGKLPEKKIDGKAIRALMLGEAGATSRHQYYTLMHGPGTVRSGNWKFYPWKEGSADKGRDNATWPPSPDPFQLYDVSKDIGETTNVASVHPDVVARLKAAYDAHVEEITANRRPTALMTRRPDAVSPERPGQPQKKQPNKKQAQKKPSKN